MSKFMQIWILLAAMAVILSFLSFVIEKTIEKISRKKTSSQNKRCVRLIYCPKCGRVPNFHRKTCRNCGAELFVNFDS